jgi:hypothetical protein
VFDEGCPLCNDDCSGAMQLVADGSYEVRVSEATNDRALCLGANLGPDVWFRFTLDVQSYVYLDTYDGGTGETRLEVYAGSSCAGLVSVGCSNARCPPRSQFLQNLDAGGYYVAVEVGGGDGSPLRLFFQRATCSLNNATDMHPAEVSRYLGFTTGMPSACSSSCHAAGATDDLAMVGLCAPASLVATTCHTRTDFDTVVYANAGSECCGPGSIALGCNDDDCAAGSNPSASRLVISGRKGINFVWVDGWSPADSGQFALDVEWF